LIKNPNRRKRKDRQRKPTLIHWLAKDLPIPDVLISCASGFLWVTTTYPYTCILDLCICVCCKLKIGNEAVHCWVAVWFGKAHLSNWKWTVLIPLNAILCVLKLICFSFAATF
jgi:hypothetical protein